MSTTPHLPPTDLRRDPDESPSTRRLVLQFLALMLLLALMIAGFVRIVTGRAEGAYGNQPWVKSSLVVPRDGAPQVVAAVNGSNAAIRIG